jgi:hypothetical protein
VEKRALRLCLTFFLPSLSLELTPVADSSCLCQCLGLLKELFSFSFLPFFLLSLFSCAGAPLNIKNCRPAGPFLHTFYRFLTLPYLTLPYTKTDQASIALVACLALPCLAFFQHNSHSLVLAPRSPHAHSAAHY